MPTSISKNFLYRLALPVFAPHVSFKKHMVFEGVPLTDVRTLTACIQKNRISGSAICLKSGISESYIFSPAFHTSVFPDNNTYFRVASITKMATALIAVILFDKGILDPDAFLSDLLPDSSGTVELRGIKIRHLLSHTSGLTDPPNLEELLTDQRHWRDAVSERNIAVPGNEFHYSNLGYGLLGCVFEAVLQLSIEDIFQKFLCVPLGMQATLSAASLNAGQIMPVVRILPYRPGSALTHTKLGNIIPGPPDPSLHYGYTAGSMYINLPSLLKLILCIRNNCHPLVSEKFGNYMKSIISSYGKISPTLSYGSGLLVIQDKKISDGPVFGHQGFAYGCVDGAFWEESTGRIILSLNGGCSEARKGRLGIANYDLCRWAFRKEMPGWKS